MATHTIGTTGDFSTIQAWVDSLAATLTSPEIGQLQNQNFTAGATFSGHTTSTTNTITLTTATGASFRDNANALTNALRPDAANGACVTVATGYAIAFTVSVDNVIFRGVQVRTTGTQSQPFECGSSANILFDACLVEGTNGPYVVSCAGSGCGAQNCLVIASAAGGGATHGVKLAQNGFIYDTTIVRPAFRAAGGTGVRSSYFVVDARNVCVFNFTAAFGAPGGGGSYASTSDYNATDVTPIGTAQGSHNLTSLTYANQFQDVGSTSSYASTMDFRLKTGSALIAAGVAVTGITADVVGTTRPATPDVGAWQTAGGGGGDTTPPTLGTRAVPAAGTTLTGVLSESCVPASGTGGFTLAGTAATVASWAIAGGTALTLTLSGTVYSGETVTLSYSRAATTDDIADVAGNFLADFSGAAVTNNSTQAAPHTPRRRPVMYIALGAWG